MMSSSAGVELTSGDSPPSPDPPLLLHLQGPESHHLAGPRMGPPALAQEVQVNVFDPGGLPAHLWSAGVEQPGHAHTEVL